MENDILKYLYDLAIKQWEIEIDNLDKEEKELRKDSPNAIWVGSDDKTSIIQKREVLDKLSDWIKTWKSRTKQHHKIRMWWTWVSRLYKVVSCNILNKDYDCYYCYGSKYKTTTLGDKNDGITLYRFCENNAEIELEDWYNDGGAHYFFDWYDNFCWEYINKAPTYLIEIAEILEVK